MRTKLLINLTCLTPPLTGIGYYTKNIVKECLQRDIELVGIKNGKILNTKDIMDLLISLEDNSAIVDSTSFKKRALAVLRSFPGIYLFKYYLVSYRAKKELNALAIQGFTYFEPNFVPLKFSGDIITTIHDLSFLTYPEFHPAGRVRYLTKMVKKTVSASTKIIVDTDFIGHELIKYYSLPKDFVSKVYLGVEDKFRVYSEIETRNTLDKLNIKNDQYILSVATLEPRKNLSKLVESYRGLSNELKDKYPLVLTGSSGWKNSDFFMSIQDLIESKHIIVTGYLSDIELNHIYSGASLFVYPSLYEGFGLPIIEAMASGTAVITSDRGATAEVAGDAAILVDPESFEAIADAISGVLLNDKLKFSLESKSLKRASLFTWSKCVEQILMIIKSNKV